jgi:hypothetical protein
MQVLKINDLAIVSHDVQSHARSRNAVTARKLTALHIVERPPIR